MKQALCFLAVAGVLAAQPKLLVNANLDTHPAGGGLEAAYKSQLAAQPQPAWIGWAVPSVRSYNMGCEYVFRDGQSIQGQGVVHLEPPDHAIILIRADQGAVSRVRYLSPDCEIDAGGAPFHWLTDVQPAQSVALLSTLVSEREPGNSSAMSAIAMHADASADQALDRFAGAQEPLSIRQRAVSLLATERGHHGFEVVKGLLANDTDERVKERAVQALGNSKDPGALDLLLETARRNSDPRLRAQAVGTLSRRPEPKILDTLRAAIDDPDANVQRRAISTINSLPDGDGVPLLIQVIKTTKDTQVRKQAMNALQNSRDPRALAFFVDVLK
ncbi:MAG: HEAT repeat domain-containing protein [Bryobacteraceae bacterium]